MSDKKKAGSTEMAKPAEMSMAVAKPLQTRTTDNDVGKLAADLGMKMRAAPAADDFESVRANQGLYRPEECIMGHNAAGEPVYCPIWGYPVAVMHRKDPTNGDYAQVAIHLSSDCIALKGAPPNRVRTLFHPAEIVVVTVTSALDELIALAEDKTKSVEVCLTPIGKMAIDGGRTFWDWGFSKSRKSIPRVHTELDDDADDFTPGQGQLSQNASAS